MLDRPVSLWLEHINVHHKVFQVIRGNHLADGRLGKRGKEEVDRVQRAKM